MLQAFVNVFKVPDLKKRILFTLAIATSIDAAAVGVSMSLLRVEIFQPALIIGIITFFM